MNNLRRLHSVYEEHESFCQLLVLFLTFRALAALFLQPGGFLIQWSPDQLFYHAIASMASNGLYPYLDYWMEFPPIFPWLIVAAHKLSLLFPSTNNIFWFNACLHVIMLPFEAGSLILLYQLIRHLRNEMEAFRGSVAFALMFAPLFSYLGWFDSVVLFFLLLGIYGLVSHNPILTGLGIGLGFCTKLFPLAVLPAAAQVFRKPRQLMKLATATILSIVGIFAPFLIVSPTYTLAFFRTLTGRSSWETVWALFDGYKSYGAVAPLSIRNDPTTTSWVPEGFVGSHLPWLWITLAFALLGLFLWTRKIDWQDPARSTAFVGLTFCLMLLYLKGYSPQWGIYLVALSILLVRGVRGVFYGLLFSILTPLEWPVGFLLFPNSTSFLTIIIIFRTVATIVLCIEFAALVFSDVQWLAATTGYLPQIVGIASLLAAFAAVPFAMILAKQDAASNEPLAPLLADWQADPDTSYLVIVTQPEVRARVQALLPRSVNLSSMPNAFAQPWVVPRDWIKQQLADHPSSIIRSMIESADSNYADLNRRVDRSLSAEGCKLAQANYGSAVVTSYLPFHPMPNRLIDGRFSDSLALIKAGGETRKIAGDQGVSVSLLWRIYDPTDIQNRYALNITIKDSEGESVATSEFDLLPEDVTDLSKRVEECYGLIAHLSADQYGIEISVIDTKTRKPLALPDGSTVVEISQLEVESK